MVDATVSRNDDDDVRSFAKTVASHARGIDGGSRHCASDDDDGRRRRRGIISRDELRGVVNTCAQHLHRLVADHVERDRITVLLRTQRTTSRDDTIPMRDKFSRGRRTRRRHHPPLLRDPSSSMTTWMQHLRGSKRKGRRRATTRPTMRTDDDVAQRRVRR